MSLPAQRVPPTVGRRSTRYRLGDKTFFGPGSNFKVDTTQKMTVVTQFVTSDNTDSGDLSEIRRLFVQNGNVIATEPVTLGGKSFDSVSDAFNAAQKKVCDSMLVS